MLPNDGVGSEFHLLPLPPAGARWPAAPATAGKAKGAMVSTNADTARRRRLSRRRMPRLSLLLGGVALTACGGKQAGTGDASAPVAWPAEDRWPELFWQAPPEVQQTYRYAVANPDVLQWLPCFCGYRGQGHTSNQDCYIDELRPDGSVLLDPMSFG